MASPPSGSCVWRDSRVQAVLRDAEEGARQAPDRASGRLERSQTLLSALTGIGRALAADREPAWSLLLSSLRTCVASDEHGDDDIDQLALAPLGVRFEVVPWIAMASLAVQRPSWQEWFRLASSAARDARQEALELTTFGSRAQRRQAWWIAAWYETVRLRACMIAGDVGVEVHRPFVQSRLLDRDVRDGLRQLVETSSKSAIDYVRTRRVSEFPYDRLFGQRRASSAIDTPGGALADVFEWAVLQSRIERGTPCISRAWQIVASDWPGDLLSSWVPRILANYSNVDASGGDDAPPAAQGIGFDVSAERLRFCWKFWRTVVLDGDPIAPAFRPRVVSTAYGLLEYRGQTDGSHVWVSPIPRKEARWLVFMDRPGVPGPGSIPGAAEVEKRNTHPG